MGPRERSAVGLPRFAGDAHSLYEGRGHTNNARSLLIAFVQHHQLQLSHGTMTDADPKSLSEETPVGGSAVAPPKQNVEEDSDPDFDDLDGTDIISHTTQ